MSDDDFKCLVPFPDESPSFVYGFESGMIWQRMESDETEIETNVPLHYENRKVFERMASARGYDVEINKHDECWAYFVFTKKRSHLRVVK